LPSDVRLKVEYFSLFSSFLNSFSGLIPSLDLFVDPLFIFITFTLPHFTEIVTKKIDSKRVIFSLELLVIPIDFRFFETFRQKHFLVDIFWFEWKGSSEYIFKEEKIFGWRVFIQAHFDIIESTVSHPFRRIYHMWSYLFYYICGGDLSQSEILYGIY